jgi:hypothetical protein
MKLETLRGSDLAFTAVPLATGAEQWSELFAMVMGFAFLAGLGLIILFNRWNRPDLDSEHAAHILTQLNTFGGTRGGAVVVRSLDALDDRDVLREIRGLFHGERSSEVRVRSATREILREVRAELRARSPPVSKVPVRAVQEAFLTAILGAIAILPVAVWRDATRSGSAAAPGLPEFIAAGQWVLDGGLAVVTAFPYTDVLFAFALTFGILGAETVWSLWMVPPVVLIALAVTYWTLERRLDTDRELTGPSVSGWSRRFGILAVLTWLTGTILAALGGVIPGPWFVQAALGAVLAVSAVTYYVLRTRDPVPEPEPPVDVETDAADPFGPSEDPEDGEEPPEPERPPLRDHVRGVNWKRAAFIGVLTLGFAHQLTAFLAAVTVAGAAVTYWTRRTLRRWKYSAERDGRDALALDIVHSLTVTAAALTLPLMIGYAIAAFGTGKALEVARVVLDAPDGTVLAVAFLAVMVALALAVMFLDRFADVRRGIRRAMSVQAVRSVMFARTFPIVLTVIAAVLLAAFRVPAVAVVAVALAVGLIARVTFMAYNYLTYRWQNYGGRDTTASRVVVNGRQVTDADGEPVYIADVNGHRTAHRDLDQLLKQVRRDARSLFQDGRPETGSFARYYYQNGVKRGKVDMESVADELVGDVRTRFKANVKQTDADAETILDKLRSEYPSAVVERVVKDLKDHSKVTRREDRFYWLGD